MPMYDFLMLWLTLYLVIFIHELGHFIACQALGVKVDEVSIGLGTAVLKIGDWYLRLFPLGGYTLPRFKENLGYRPIYPEDYCGRSPYERLTIVLAGILFNLSSALIYGLWTMDYGLFTTTSLIMALIQFIPRKGSDGHEAITIIKNEL
jgi:regulator of sigma E protease